MEKNADRLVATIKTVCRMRGASEGRVAQFVAQTVNAAQTSFAKIEFVKLVAEQIIPVQKIKLVLASSAPTPVLCPVNVVCVLSATCSIMEFNATAHME